MANRKLFPPSDPRGRLAKRIAPGFWVDGTGALHVSIPELLEVFGWPDDEVHRIEVEQMVKRAMLDLDPDTQIIDDL